MTTDTRLGTFAENYVELEATHSDFGQFPTVRVNGKPTTFKSVAEIDKFYGDDVQPSDWDVFAKLAGACDREISFKGLDAADATASQARQCEHLRREYGQAIQRAQALHSSYIERRRYELGSAAQDRMTARGAPSPNTQFSRSGGGGDSTSAPTEGRATWVRTTDRKPATLARGQRWVDQEIVAGIVAGSTGRDAAVIGQHGSLGSMIRAMSTSSGSAVVPEIWAGNIIDRARNFSAVLKAGAEIVPMEAKTVHIGRLTGDPTVAFRTEGSAVTASDPTFDNVTLDAKTASAQVTGSMEWFQDNEDGVDELVTNAIAQAFAQKIDQVSLYGAITTGAGTINLPTPPNPRGVLGTLNAVASSSVLGAATNGTAQTAGSFYNELLDLLYTPQGYNEIPNAMIWNSKASLQYQKAYDTTGQPLQEPRAIAELQKYVSNELESYTQGTMTSRATDVFLGDWKQCLIGQRLGFTIQTLTERYAETGQISIIAHWRGDVGIARPRAFAVYKALQGSL